MTEELEVEIIVIEEIVDEDEAGATHVRFIIDNNNDGSTFVVKAKPEAKVAKVIEKMYEHLGRPQQPGDRLTRQPDGSDVFAAAGETAGDYAGRVPAKKRIWRFVGAPGGAMS